LSLDARDKTEVVLQRHAGARRRQDGAEAPDLVLVPGELWVLDAVVRADGYVVRVVGLRVDVAGERADL
jgi:hypothetical protein